jgi:hypothetical protein
MKARCRSVRCILCMQACYVIPAVFWYHLYDLRGYQTTCTLRD